jgi:hypothetical protein
LNFCGPAIIRRAVSFALVRAVERLMNDIRTPSE